MLYAISALSQVLCQRKTGKRIRKINIFREKLKKLEDMHVMNNVKKNKDAIYWVFRENSYTTSYFLLYPLCDMESYIYNPHSPLPNPPGNTEKTTKSHVTFRIVTHFLLLRSQLTIRRSLHIWGVLTIAMNCYVKITAETVSSS